MKSSQRSFSALDLHDFKKDSREVTAKKGYENRGVKSRIVEGEVGSLESGEEMEVRRQVGAKTRIQEVLQVILATGHHDCHQRPLTSESSNGSPKPKFPTIFGGKLFKFDC